MSLDFNFEDMIERLGREEYDRITDHPTKGGEAWHPVTETLIWVCMAVGLPGIHGKYVDKFIARTQALQAISGGDILSQDGRIHITEEDICAHEGLRTNVSFESDAKFYAKLFRIAQEEGERKARQQGKSAFDAVAEAVANNEVEEANRMLVDELGALKAEMAELAKREKALKGMIGTRMTMAGVDALDGLAYRVTRSETERSVLDTAAVKALLSDPPMKTTVSTTFRVNARVVEAA